MATKTQKTHRKKKTFIKGKMAVPPWNGQSQGGLNLVYERSTSPSSHLSPTKRTVLIKDIPVRTISNTSNGKTTLYNFKPDYQTFWNLITRHYSLTLVLFMRATFHRYFASQESRNQHTECVSTLLLTKIKAWIKQEIQLLLSFTYKRHC